MTFVGYKKSGVSTFKLFASTIPPINSATKIIKAHVCSATNPTGLPRKLKITPTTLPTIAGNASTALPARLLRSSTSLFSHIFKAPSTFGGEAGLPPPLPPKTPVIASAFVESHSKGCKY